eukprot:TRINITY_DN12375_c1_g2_i1.p1 TRINITY_DN12375_c1_g2~~TRINITY_DN12375_c1_g2_i1.p1  ORF type:complete len:1295 (+),score=356.46 TRINITY_DN12375_c1_g2_i1:58-3885(+)
MTSTVSSGAPGHVEALELSNFKSYKGTHYIGPFRDFTCIIGPNGSGKSNIMDAISFVLGIKTHSMRAGNLKDLIYSVDDEGAVNKASVKLHFAVSGSKTVIFQRTVNSSGTSDFLVDGKKHSWANYEKVLSQYNILTSSRNCLIFQGEVESMVHKPLRDITSMIELVAGSASLKADYDQKKADHERASERLAQTSKQKRGAGLEQDLLKMQKAEADDYFKYMNQLANAKSDYAMLQFYHIENELVQAKKRHQPALKVVSDKEKSTLDLEEKHKAYKQRIAELHKETMQLMKVERSKQHDLLAKKRTAAESDMQTKNLEVKIQRTKAQLTVAKKEGSAQSARLNSLQQDLAEQETLLKQHESVWLEEDKQGTLSDKDYAEFRKLREEAQAATIGLTQEAKQLKRETDLLTHQISSLEEVEKDHARRLRAADDRIATFEKKKEDLQNQGIDTSQQKDERSSELLNIKGLLQRQKQELAKKEIALKTITEDVASIRQDRDESKSSLRMKQALQDMMKLFNGVRGRLCDLITIPSAKYKIAITVAMGKNMESIVTDTDRTAHECVQYLKDQRIGMMNFIPLTSVRGKPVTDDHRILGGSAVPAVDCIKFEPTLLPAIRYSLGTTIISGNLKDAEKVAWEHPSGQRHKVVTLDGTLLQKNGVMTGGSASIESRARKFDEKDLEEKKEKRDKLAAEIRAIHMESVRAEERARDLDSQVQSEELKSAHLKTDVQQWEEKQNQATEEKAKLTKEAEVFGPKLQTLRKQKAALDEKSDTLQKKITEAQSKIFGKFGMRVNIRDIQDFERRELNKEKDRASKRTSIHSIIQKLKAQLEFEQKREQPSSAEELSAKLKELQEEYATKKKDDQKRQKAESAIDKELADAKKSVEAKSKSLKGEEVEIKKLKKLLDTRNEELEQAKKDRQHLLTISEKLRAQRSVLYSKCSAEDIELPLASNKRKREGSEFSVNKGGPGDHVEEGEKQQYQETQTDDKGYITVSEVFASRSQMTGDDPKASKKKQTTSDVAKQAHQQLVGLDFTKLPQELRAAVRKGKVEFKEKAVILEHKIDKIHDKLDKLTPNLKANNKFKDAAGKLNKTIVDWDEARSEHKKATAAFNAVKEKRFVKFNKAFTTVSKEFTEIYSALTLGTRGAGVGGQAYLLSDEYDEPYLGDTSWGVVPPGKMHREKEHLSGGEKTVAALALLFAIHKVCPSPFFVLDEVDAALDQGNVAKVVNYVRSTCTSCQFLVISLKESFYVASNGIVGVHKVTKEHSSGIKTLDLTQYS